MGEKSDQIAREIEQSRAALGSNLQELELKVKNVTDWRQLFRRHTMPILAGVFAAGLLLAFLVGGKSKGA